MGDILLGTEREGEEKVLILQSLWYKKTIRGNVMEEGVWRHGRIWLGKGKKESRQESSLEQIRW